MKVWLFELKQRPDLYCRARGSQTRLHDPRRSLRPSGSSCSASPPRTKAALKVGLLLVLLGASQCNRSPATGSARSCPVQLQCAAGSTGGCPVQPQSATGSTRSCPVQLQFATGSTGSCPVHPQFATGSTGSCPVHPQFATGSTGSCPVQPHSSTGSNGCCQLSMLLVCPEYLARPHGPLRSHVTCFSPAVRLV